MKFCSGPGSGLSVSSTVFWRSVSWDDYGVRVVSRVVWLAAFMVSCITVSCGKILLAGGSVLTKVINYPADDVSKPYPAFPLYTSYYWHSARSFSSCCNFKGK